MIMKHLAIRLPNWLGDVIMTLPTLEALSSAGFTFELFGKKWAKDLFSAYPYKVHTLPSQFWQIRDMYQQMNISPCVLLTNGLSSAMHLAFTGIKGIGYRSDGRRPLLYRSLEKKPGLHEIEYFWELAQFAVKQALLPPKNPNLLLSDAYHEQAHAILEKYQIHSNFVVICPGAIGKGAGKASKIWPHWRVLSEKLLEEGKQLIACPAPFETEYFQQVLAEGVCMIPDLNIPLFAAVMQRASQVIANDSGPMHLAAAVHAPVLGIFGQTDPQRCRPWGGEFIGAPLHWPSCEEVLRVIATAS
ncbi:MAG: hypothetical protein CK424_06510 [Legionella sp.]|nr:MAG: hypothetical protein CK424_06510 [Legionella sp.]